MNTSNQIDLKLSIKKIKKKIYVVDGYINYPLTIEDNTIKCVCADAIKGLTHHFCKHVKYYFYQSGLDLTLLNYWFKIKKDILSSILTDNVNNSDLWNIVDDLIFNQDCSFCLEKIKIDKKYHICPTCQGILHEKCFLKWETKGIGCMLCRS